MIVLGIETTCDETAASVVALQRDGRGHILSNEILSQIEEHAPYGGVVPEIAARAHVTALDGLINASARQIMVSPPKTLATKRHSRVIECTDPGRGRK